MKNQQKGFGQMYWEFAIEFTKYAALTYALLCVAVIVSKYLQTKDWKFALSVLAQENKWHRKGLQLQQTLLSKTIRFARISAVTGAFALLLLMTLQMAFPGSGWWSS